MNRLDPAMPFLERALHRAEAEAVFTELVQQDGMRITVQEIELIRHKPGRRAVIQYNVRIEGAPNGPGALERTLVGKARAKGLDRKSFRITNELCSEFKRTDPEAVGVPQPFKMVPAFNLWLQDKVPGEPLGSMLVRNDIVALSPLIAQAAYKIHGSAVVPMRTHTVADELEILRERLMAVSLARPKWNPRITKLIEQCYTLALALPQVVPRPIHRDFHPGQILVDGPRLWLLDFDLFSFGDPAVDIGNFIAHLTEFSLRYFGSERQLAAMEQGIENTYVSLAGEEVRRRIHIYVLLTLARHIYISTQFEERRAFTESLLNLCEERMIAIG